MCDPQRFGDVSVSFVQPFVALCEIQRPPNNFFDVALINAIADAYDHLAKDDQCRAIVLASQGQHFCAGADFSKPPPDKPPTLESGNPLYAAAIRVFRAKQPVIAAVQGAAIGGGFGLALSADFRVGCSETRFAANFVKLGFSPGFGMTHTLPRVIGERQALEIFMSGRRVRGEEAKTLGLLDRFTNQSNVRAEAITLAASFAENAPLAVQSVRRTLRGDIASQIKRATDAEFKDQFRLQQTEDFKEGIKAVAERRAGNFVGR